MYFNMLPMMPGGEQLAERLKAALLIAPDQFEYRWAAD
jgi:hypothetical protein